MVMRQPSRDIVQLIQNAGLGTYATDLFTAKVPETPDACVTVIDTGGFEPDNHLVFDKPTVQIITRAKAYSTAYTKAAAIKEALRGVNNVSVGGSRYIAIYLFSDIISMGFDEKNRAKLSLNVRLHRTTT